MMMVSIAAIFLFLIRSEVSAFLVLLLNKDLSSLLSGSNLIIPSDLCLINCPGWEVFVVCPGNTFAIWLVLWALCSFIFGSDSLFGPEFLLDDNSKTELDALLGRAKAGGPDGRLVFTSDPCGRSLPEIPMDLLLAS